jgi:thiol-disulfide isomerase/thioredoxin
MRIQRGTLGLFLAGLGVLLLGGVSLIVVARQRADNALQPTDFSAIPAPVHYQAPEIALTDLNGIQRSLSRYRGQVVIVNLWATWCPPCQAEMPLLQTFFEKHAAEGLTVIAIEDGEPETDVRSFVKQYGLTFPVWLDPTHKATDQAFKTSNLPTSYVVDRTGEVRLTWLGAISAVNLENFVTPVIRER